MKDICVRVKELRKELGMSQVEFSKNLGVTNAHISKIEKGGTVPSEALIKLISKEYSVNSEWLKDGKKPMFNEDLEYYTTENMEMANNKLNKLLSCSDSIRNIISEINLTFADILELENLNETKTLMYLNLMLELFETIRNNNTFIKEHLQSEQYIMRNIKQSYLSNYKFEINKCIDEFEKIFNEYNK